MSQNSFIKQYLAKQQELLRQRLEREAREAYETNGKCCFSRWLQISKLLQCFLQVKGELCGVCDWLACRYSFSLERESVMQVISCRPYMQTIGLCNLQMF